MNTIVGFELCTLSDDELVKKVDQMTDGLFDYKHKHERERILTRQIPARPDDDYDLLIGALLLRFKSLQAACKEVVKGYDTDGMEQMKIREHVFYNVCKSSLKD